MKAHILWLSFGLVISLNSVALESQKPFHVYDPKLSAARNWNEALLSSISRDYARPTVHARNLYHASIAMYDAWAVFDAVAEPYLLGTNNISGCGMTVSQISLFQQSTIDVDSARSEAISYAVYRFIRNRFRLEDEQGNLIEEAPNFPSILAGMKQVMADAGYDVNNTSVDLSTGSPAALGNYIAGCIFSYGRQDGANEINAYKNEGYTPVNGSLNPAEPGTRGLIDADRWQPLELDITVDQAGNKTGTPPFLGANWGKVAPFALTEADRVVQERNGVNYTMYHDPGAPPGAHSMPEAYKWNHLLVAIWSSSLDSKSSVMVDISPAAVGNTRALPMTIEGLRDFYKDDGGVNDSGHEVNPTTGDSYAPQIVPFGDYTRVLAEFWADGPDSLTPPGHWFRILNEAVHDHAAFIPKFEGVGPEMTRLEWDVKAYFTLGGAMHDAAVTAWGIKGWYDYIRPVSAIRYMASKGQSTDPNLSSYHEDGVLLKEGFIELVGEGDPLAGDNGEHLGKIKFFAWRGPDYIDYEESDELVPTALNEAGVGWILAENWWPYQRPTFVTPPFAGYVSGHSTFSRAAAEVLTLLTGNEFFPGGMAEFVAEKNEFLVFEEGPSVDVRLQWATYRDASDQCSLSRIYGGIHPPVDDIPGRLAGIKVGHSAFEKAKSYFDGSVRQDSNATPREMRRGGKSGGVLGFNLAIYIFLCTILCLVRCFKGGNIS